MLNEQLFKTTVKTKLTKVQTITTYKDDGTIETKTVTISPTDDLLDALWETINHIKMFAQFATPVPLAITPAGVTGTELPSSGWIS